MSVRQDALRRQYESRVDGNGAPATRGVDGNGRPIPRVRTRNRFWRWFWLLFLLTLLGGFLHGRGTLAKWYAKACGEGHENTAVGKALGSGRLAAADGAEANALKSYVNYSAAELNQLCEYVRNSPNVRENAAYNKIMSSVQFYYNADENVVNAYAGIRKSDDKAVRIIVLLGGAARFGRVASLAVAAELCGDKGAGKRFVDALRPECLRKFDEATALSMVQDAGLVAAAADEKVLAKANAVSAGLMLGVIAHEAGHQALCHTLNTSEKVNLDISRNQEREADSFASSVIASSPFGEYILAGTLFWHYALAMQQGDSAVATTHPLSKERFENFVRANQELAASMGITLKN